MRTTGGSSHAVPEAGNPIAGLIKKVMGGVRSCSAGSADGAQARRVDGLDAAVGRQVYGDEDHGPV
ncbi:MAG: hypothetical protein ACRDTJ_03590, partial [Pseudonocardiaceae bacterium]